MVVMSVRPDSSADDLGLRPGDRLTMVNDRDANTPSDVKAGSIRQRPRRCHPVGRQKTITLSLALVPP